MTDFLSNLFRVIKLENGLTALLIADLHSTKHPSQDVDDIQGNDITL